VKFKHFDCDCKSLSHVMRVCYEQPEDFEEDWGYMLYMNVMLDKHVGFFKRVWNAIKYVFTPQYTMCELEFIYNDETVDGIYNALKEWKHNKKLWDKKFEAARLKRKLEKARKDSLEKKKAKKNKRLEDAKNKV